MGNGVGNCGSEHAASAVVSPAERFLERCERDLGAETRREAVDTKVAVVVRGLDPSVRVETQVTSQPQFLLRPGDAPCAGYATDVTRRAIEHIERLLFSPGTTKRLAP
jgi:hypothetical protein